MEKPARRVGLRVSDVSPKETRGHLPTPSSRRPGRERNFCKQIGFLLVFALCTLFTYYVTVVRLQPPRKGDRLSKLSVFEHSKHLPNELPVRDSHSEQEPQDRYYGHRFPFKLPSIDWDPGEITSWIHWGKGDKQLERSRSETRSKGSETRKELREIGSGGKSLGEDGGLHSQGQEMESQSEGGLSDEVQGLSDKVQGRSDKVEGLSDEAKGRLDGAKGLSDGAQGLLNKVEGLSDSKQGQLDDVPVRQEGESSADMDENDDVALESAGNSTPVLKRVVAELKIQAEKNPLLSHSLVSGEETGGESGKSVGNEEGGAAGGSEQGAEEGGAKKKKKKRRRFNSPPDLWDPLPDEGYHQCVERDAEWTVPPAVEEKGYFYPGLDGGLSQQVFEITNSVAVARILNVTLVIPQLGFDPYWKDGSNFSTVFDLDHFRKVLADDIRVITVPELPENMQNEYFWRIIDRIPYGREDEYKTKYNDSFFSTDQVTKSYSFFTALDNYLRPPLEKLRCRAKYEALKFHPQIITTAQRLMSRMRERANGPFLALHLRFETDMVMYSASCEYGIDDPEEKKYWDAQRKERAWPDPEPDDVMRKQGRCPATPGEVGRWLQAMGFNESTQVYLASGAIYHEDVFMPAFLDMFPNTMRKEDLFTEEEAAQLKGKNNILAGIDFEVLVNADVTALTFHGMMKSSISGHRNWLGFRKTFTYPIWEADVRNLPWKEFKTRARKATSYGQPRDRSGGEVMGNPIPECMCQG